MKIISIRKFEKSSQNDASLRFTVWNFQQDQFVIFNQSLTFYLNFIWPLN